MRLADSDLELLPEKGIFIRSARTLVLADLHFGKINHFRQAGLPVPISANKKNAESLIDIINKWKPVRTVFLGDLFHSHYNDEWEVVGQIVNNFPACRFTLVRGNHDIMSEQQYYRKGIAVVDHEFIDRWMLTHEPLDADKVPEGRINMAGHIHPGALLQGRARQAITLPCFWFSKTHLILPAFGSFTGIVAIRPVENDSLFVVLENKVMEVTLDSKKKKNRLAT